MNEPKVIAVVLTWNQREVSLQCIESVLACRYPNTELLVVDNGSTDGLAETLRARYSKHHLILNGENIGYVGGNNLGIHEALQQSADYVFLLNNDIVVEPDAIGRLVDCAEASRDLGVIGPVVYNTTTGEPDNFGWRFHAPKGELTKIRTRPAGVNGLVRADVVPGCSFFLRASAVEQVGYLDGRMFIFWEDTDYSLRFKRHGWGVGIVPDAVVWHENALTVPKDSPARIYYNFRNHLLLMQKHGTRRHWLTFLPYFVRNDCLEVFRESAATFRAQPGRALKKAAAAAWGVIAFGLRRWGKGPAWLYS